MSTDGGDEHLNEKSFGSNVMDPWSSFDLQQVNSRVASPQPQQQGSANMDSELASIVSSLSALSNPQQQQQVGPNGASQLGGFRRSSFGTDIESDMLLYSSSSVMTASNMNNAGPGSSHPNSPVLQRRTALSVGTAPPYSSMHVSNHSQRVNFVNGGGHYSASIAGPILFTTNSSSASSSPNSNQLPTNSGGGGFFEKFGKSLIEGTRELEKSSIDNENLSKTISNASSQITLDQSARNKNLRRSSITSNSTTSESVEFQQPHVRNIWNVANAPIFKPNENFLPDQYSLPPPNFQSPFIPPHILSSPQPPPSTSAPQQQQQHLNLSNDASQSPFLYMPNEMYQSQQQQQHQQQQQQQHQAKRKPAKKQQSNPYLENNNGNNVVNNSGKNYNSKKNKPPSRLSSPPPQTSTASVKQSFKHHHNGNSNNFNGNVSVNTRSPLLEEFRVNPTNKVYTLNDIFGYVLEFCKDQHGSRFIQHELSSVSPSEREVIFNEIRDHAIDLSDDVFGNYVIQKFFEYGSKTQKDVLESQFKGKMKKLSMQMYACRVIQKALEFIEPQQRIDLVKELSSCVLQMIKDQNGNHVIQKAIERIPMDNLPFILNSLDGQIYHLSTHSYGCRVIQRILEFGSESDQSRILAELKDFIPYLIQDQYGNYVIQHILQQNDKDSFQDMRNIKQEIINIVSQNVVEFSKHKFASNVVEKAILYGSPNQKKLVMSKILPRNEDHAKDLEDSAPMILMMRDQFANYVVQKLVGVSEGQDKRLIVIAIRAYLDKLNKSDSMGNRHLASVEKLASLVESVRL